MRIVIALNAERCPDCDANGSTTNRASVSAGTSSARPATRASTSRRTRRKCISCSALAAAGPRDILPPLIRVIVARRASLFCSAVMPASANARREAGNPTTTSTLGGGDHVAMDAAARASAASISVEIQVRVEAVSRCSIAARTQLASLVRSAMSNL